MSQSSAVDARAGTSETATVAGLTKHTATTIPRTAPSVAQAQATGYSDTELSAARLVAAPRIARWVAGAVALVLFAMLINTLITNKNFQWDIVGDYFLADKILDGLKITLWLTLATLVTGYILGIGIALLRLSSNPLLSFSGAIFVWIFRSVPPLVLLLFFFEISSLYPKLSVGIPFGPEFASVQTAHLFSALFAAWVALSLDVAAFAGEIVRGGIIAVPSGQVEAAKSIGLTNARVFRRVVWPQAVPSILPASGNLVIGLLKSTSLVSVIAVHDLLGSAELIYSDNFQVIPLLLVATIWYVILTGLLSIGQYFVERRYSRSTREYRPLKQIIRENAPLFSYRRLVPKPSLTGAKS